MLSCFLAFSFSQFIRPHLIHVPSPGVSCSCAGCWPSFHVWRQAPESRCFISRSAFILSPRIKGFNFSLPTAEKRDGTLLGFSCGRHSRRKKPSDLTVNTLDQCSWGPQHGRPSALSVCPCKALPSPRTPAPPPPTSLCFKETGAEYPTRTEAGADGGNAESLK